MGDKKERYKKQRKETREKNMMKNKDNEGKRKGEKQWQEEKKKNEENEWWKKVRKGVNEGQDEEKGGEGMKGSSNVLIIDVFMMTSWVGLASWTKREAEQCECESQSMYARELGTDSKGVE